MKSSLFHLKSWGSAACLLSLLMSATGALCAKPVAMAPVAMAPMAMAPVAMAPVAMAPVAMAPVAMAMAPVAMAMAMAQQKYKVFNLGNDPQDLALNDSGQVVGQALNGLNSYAFLFSASGSRQNLTPSLPAGTTYSGALDINNSGLIVGYFRAPSTKGELHAFALANGVGRDLNDFLPAGSTASVATSVNTWGQITGYASTGKDPIYGNLDHAFLFSNGTAIDIHGLMPQLYGYAAISSHGAAINSSAQIAGTFRARGRSGFVDDHAFLYTNSTGEVLNLEELLPSTTVSSSADAINDAGQVVGTFLVSSPTARYESHAFLYTSATGVMQDLDGWLPAGFADSYATSINNKGQILINADRLERGVLRSHAFLLSDGVLQDLNGLMPSTSWLAYSADDINNNGQIAGIGSQSLQSAAFLMTPHGKR